eukprot:EG_transcript_1326
MATEPLGSERIAVPEGQLGCRRKRGAPTVPVSNLKLRRVLQARIEEVQGQGAPQAGGARPPPPRSKPRQRCARGAAGRAKGQSSPETVVPQCTDRGVALPDPEGDLFGPMVAPADCFSAPTASPPAATPLPSLIRIAAYTADTQGRTSFAVRRRASFVPRLDPPPPSPGPSTAAADSTSAQTATAPTHPKGEPPALLCDTTGDAAESTAVHVELRGADLLATLQSQFGFSAFRPGQEAVVQRILAGQSTLAILPTGMGKSLCYQMAALLLAQAETQKPRFALVVSPLISLMTDQVKKLPRCLAGACLSAGHGGAALPQTMQAVRQGRLQLLFVSPERLVQNASFLQQLQGVADQLAFVCLDEAHCMSEWGHNYRTAYLHVAQILRSKLGVRCVLATTATCTLSCIDDLCRILDVERPDSEELAASLQGGPGLGTVVSSGGVMLCTAPRHNLRLSASVLPACRDPGERHRARLAALRRILTSPDLPDGGAVIVYVHLKKDADETAEFVRRNVCESCAAYHADKSPEDRRRIQMEFMRDELRVIVATVAFGLGIDKPNVRAVVHLSCPPSLEAYAQEVGRAGRDGAPAHCHVIVDRHDFWVHRSKAHADVVDLPAVRRLCAAALDLPRCEANAQLLAEGREVRVFLKKSSMAFELDIKEEVLETLLALLTIHHPDLLEPRPAACHTVHIRFPEDRPEVSGPSVLHETRDNRKYLSHGAPVVATSSVSTLPTAPRRLSTQRSAALTYHSVLDRLGMEDDVLAHLYQQRAKQPPVRKGTWAFNVGALSRDLGLSAEDLLARLQELRVHKGLRVAPQGASYCVHLKRVVRAEEAEAIALELWQRHAFVTRTARDKVVVAYGLLQDFAEACQAGEELSDGLHAALGRYLLERHTPGGRRPRTGVSSGLAERESADGPTPVTASEGRAVTNPEATPGEEDPVSGDAPLAAVERRRADDPVHPTYLARQRALFPPQSRMCDLLTDVFGLLREHGPQFDCGRQIARILHGLHSPKFPVETWGSHRLWGRYYDVDFEAVLQLSCTALRGNGEPTQEATLPNPSRHAERCTKSPIPPPSQ